MQNNQSDIKIMTKNFITLDIGGTSIKSAIVKSDGTFDKNSY